MEKKGAFLRKRDNELEDRPEKIIIKLKKDLHVERKKVAAIFLSHLIYRDDSICGISTTLNFLKNKNWRQIQNTPSFL